MKISAMSFAYWIGIS